MPGRLRADTEVVMSAPTAARTVRYGLLSIAAVIALLVANAVQYAQGPGRPQPNWSTDPLDPYPIPPELQGVDLLKQTQAEADAKSTGCVVCHQNVKEPHWKDTLHIGCTDCHGGCPTECNDKEKAHVQPRYPEFWRTAANPVRSYTLLNHEYPEFIRFVNPGDLRIAHISCGLGGCHSKEVEQNRKSIMTSGCMLWGAALYNNGTVPYKRSRHGEFYSMTGVPLRAQTVPPPTEAECKLGVVPYLDPLPHFESSQPGNVLRFFETGGRFRPETGIPQREEESGRPRTRLSNRGLGTDNRTDPVLVSLNKTRLFDPTLNFLGTNDKAGDYRSSGCTTCHVVYANDRSPITSGPFAKFGNRGTAADNPDPTIPKNEPGHPVEHRFRTGIPTSQCLTCHVHPGTNVLNSYPGFMWWDEETEGHLMYPHHRKKLSSEQFVRAAMFNPDEAAAFGKWSDPEFLANITDLNGEMNKTQFADFHSHGWVFRAVFRHDREGKLLDRTGAPVADVTPAKLQSAMKAPEAARDVYRKKHETLDALRVAEHAFEEKYKSLPIHYMDVHLEKGMHCVDCHFVQDMHGNSRLQMEVRAACEIQCVDCHGTSVRGATLRTSGPASYTSSKDPNAPGRDLLAMRTPGGKRRFERVGDTIFQNSMVEEGLRWEVVQTKDTINPDHPRYNKKAHLAKTVRFEGDQMVWGTTSPELEGKCAHANQNMSCIACHSAWNPSCYGCHLPQRANAKMPHLHWDGDVTRNYTPYNFQTLRDDVYMLGRDGDATGNRIGPARSSCAVHVGSYNNNRESIYVQQQTISAEGQSGIAFSTNVPHTVRGRDGTKQCTDCHVSRNNDNNAWMAQLQMHGTNYLNLIGRYAWVAAGEHGLVAPVVTERDEPQAVIGSTMHCLSFPEHFEEHVKNGRILEHAHEHPGYDISEGLTRPFKKHEVLQVQNRGEYLYAACGEDGVRVFDIAMIDNKAFSERITTEPVSPLGQRFYVRTKNARAIASPTTIAPDPTRTHRPENRESPIAGLYAYIYVADCEEGLILIGIATTIDGNPSNNFLKREVTFNPDGILNGARAITIVGNFAYIGCNAGLVIVSLEDPKCPKVVKVIGEPFIKCPKSIAVQFRYCYLIDDEGIKILDTTRLDDPQPVSLMRMEDLHSIYLARTYAYVAAGHRGLLILDIKQADRPKVDQWFNADGCICDCRDVKLGITYVSEFAYLADGKNGMRIVQLTSPETPGNDGFSPRPTPCLIATYPIKHGGKALSVSKGLDRDRAVDESGNQIAVFGRVGARPLDFEEQRRLFFHNDKLWTVVDDPSDAMYGQPRK
jgi:hypothetical protein